MNNLLLISREKCRSRRTRRDTKLSTRNTHIVWISHCTIISILWYNYRYVYIYNIMYTTCVSVTRCRRHDDYYSLPTGRNITNAHSAAVSAIARSLCAVGPDRNRNKFSICFHINHRYSTITLITIVIIVYATCAMTVSENAYKTKRPAIRRYCIPNTSPLSPCH